MNPHRWTSRYFTEEDGLDLRADKLLGIAEDNGDRAQDDAAIENAAALLVGHYAHVQIYKAQRPLSCRQCGADIAAGDYFISYSKHGAEVAATAECRPWNAEIQNAPLGRKCPLRGA